MAVSPDKTVFLSLRIEKELAERLALLAAQNDRSMSAEARIAIRDRLEQEAAA